MTSRDVTSGESRMVLVHQVYLGRTSVVLSGTPRPMELEMWDQAPLPTTPRGYKSPWWCRDARGLWYVAVLPRANSHIEDPTVMRGYLLDAEVRRTLQQLHAHSERPWGPLKPHYSHILNGSMDERITQSVLDRTLNWSL